MREGIAAIAATGADMGTAYYLCMLARACGERGDADEGLALIDQAFNNLGKSGSKYQLPELLRTKGRAYFATASARRCCGDLVPQIAGSGSRAAYEII